MRPCRSCSSVSKTCRVAGGLEKYIECVHRVYPYDLASKQIVFPNVFSDWSMTSLAPFNRIPAEPSSSLLDIP